MRGSERLGSAQRSGTGGRQRQAGINSDHQAAFNRSSASTSARRRPLQRSEQPGAPSTARAQPEVRRLGLDATSKPSSVPRITAAPRRPGRQPHVGAAARRRLRRRLCRLGCAGALGAAAQRAASTLRQQARCPVSVSGQSCLRLGSSCSCGGSSRRGSAPLPQACLRPQFCPAARRRSAPSAATSGTAWRCRQGGWPSMWGRTLACSQCGRPSSWAPRCAGLPLAAGHLLLLRCSMLHQHLHQRSHLVHVHPRPTFLAFPACCRLLPAGARDRLRAAAAHV